MVDYAQVTTQAGGWASCMTWSWLVVASAGWRPPVIWLIGGYGVLVLEARDRLGGRTWWKRFADTDHHAEMGGTWFDEGTQLNIAREIEWYSLPTVLSPAGQGFRVSLGGRSLARYDQPVAL